MYTHIRNRKYFIPFKLVIKAESFVWTYSHRE